MELPFIEIAGYWLGIFLTFCVLSFLYKDNPFYKFAEHLFIGISIGYVVVIQWENVLKPELIDEAGKAHGLELLWVLVIPLALVLLMLCKLSKRFGWLGLYPVAFVVALFAGLQVNNVPNSDLVKQLPTAVQAVDAEKMNINTAQRRALIGLPGFVPATADAVIAERERVQAAGGDSDQALASMDDIAKLPGLSDDNRARLERSRGSLVGLDAQASVRDGDKYWFGIFSKLLLLLGLLASLVYFYFSIEQKGPVKRVARFGIWILMIGFGASFGFTVQGRLALAIGRAQDISGENKPALIADQINGPIVALISVAIITVGLVMWELQTRRKAREAAE